MSVDSNQTEVTENTIKSTALSLTDPKENGFTIKQKSFLQTLPERIPAFGLLCCLMGEVMFSVSALIVKSVTELHSMEILFFRCIVQFIPFFIITMRGKDPIFGVPGFRIQIVLRCISGTVSIICLYMAYRLMPLSDASTIFNSAPIFVTVFAYFLLKERITIVHGVSGVLTILGVFIISKPEFLFGHDGLDDIYDQRILGLILSLVAAISAAFILITLRKLKTTSVAVIGMWYALTCMISSAVVLPILAKWVMPSSVYTWLLLLAIGLATILQQFFLTISLRYESAGPISVARSFNIVLAFIWEVTIFHEPVEWTSILGACLVTICVVMIAMVRCYHENPENFQKFFQKTINFLNCHKKDEQNLESKARIETIEQNFVQREN